MHYKFSWLQLFADGTGDGAAASGATPAAAGQDSGENVSAAAGQTVGATKADRLAELGVPRDKLKRAKYSEKAAVKQPEAAAQAAAVENTEVKTDAPKRMTWAEIMDDPEYNREMQKVVAASKEKTKQAAEGLKKLTPAIEMLSKKYGIDAGDYDAIAKAVLEDDEYYEERAMKMGVTTDVVKQIESAERMAQQAEADRQQFIDEQKFQEHLAKMSAQAVELKQKYPDFDLRKELENPVFLRMTAPDQMFTLEDAYELVHRDEIKENIRQAALRISAQQVSNAVQSNKSRPNEGGASKSNNASVQTFNYKNATREQRDALKARIRAGEKIYPGQF